MSRLIFALIYFFIFFVWIPEAYASCASPKEKKDLKVRCEVKGMMGFKANGDNSVYGNEYCDWKLKGRDGGEWICRSTCYWDCQIHVEKAAPHEMLPCAHGDPTPGYLAGCTELVDKTVDLQHMTHELPLRSESGDEDSDDPRRSDEEVSKKCQKMKDEFVQKCQAPDLITTELEVPGQCCVDPMFDLNNIN